MKVSDIIPLTEKLYISDTWSKYKDNPFDSDTKFAYQQAKKGVKKLIGKVKDKFKGKDKK